MWKKIKAWWFFEYIKKYGIKGYIYGAISINNDQHPFFLDGYRSGISQDCLWHTKSWMEDLIYSLESNIPTCDPYRTNALCQIRGWKRAYKERFITT